MLHDTCWCEASGVVQRWTRTATLIHECDKCGDPLTNFESFFVPDEMRPALSILRALVDPGETVRRHAAIGLPEAIRNADRSRMFALIVRMARAIAPDATDQPLEDPRRRLSGLWQACDRLTRWPHGIENVPWSPNLPEGAVKAIAQDWVALSGTGMTDWAHSGTQKRRGLKAVGIRPATEIARLSPEVLHWAYENEWLTQHRRMHGPRLLAAFDPAELVSFGVDWRTRVDPQSLAYELGIPLHGVEQVVALGLIRADAPAMPGTGPHFHPEAAEAFMESIEAVALKSIDNGPNTEAIGSEISGTETQDGSKIGSPVTLAEAMRWVTGRAKPIGPAIALLLDGKVPFAIQRGARLAESIAVPAEHVPTIAALRFERADFSGFDFAERMIQRDALDLLNISATGSRILDALPAKGTNPKTYRVADVEKLAEDFVTLPEIAMRIGMNSAEAYEHLRKLNKAEARPGTWHRRILDELA